MGLKIALKSDIFSGVSFNNWRFFYHIARGINDELPRPNAIVVTSVYIQTILYIVLI